jgi:hypothetical protein
LEHKVSAARIIIAICASSSIGFILKYFEFDAYIILLGFRLHLSAVLPFLLVFKWQHLSLIKESFLHPKNKSLLRPVLICFLLTLFLNIILYFTELIEIGDPEYFYELGLSSIVDFPIYLIWNSPQLVLLFFFLVIIKRGMKYSFPVMFFALVFLFAYELISIREFAIDYVSIVSFILMSLVAVILIKYFENVYLFTILCFSLLWTAVLAYGSSSETLINLLLAARFTEWEGFFSVKKIISDYYLPVYFFQTLLGLAIPGLLNSKRNT